MVKSPWPESFTVKSDGNILAFQRTTTILKGKEKIPAAVYVYTKSRTKQGAEVALTLEQIESLS